VMIREKPAVQPGVGQCGLNAGEIHPLILSATSLSAPGHPAGFAPHP
jgi:hypothetical protein